MSADPIPKVLRKHFAQHNRRVIFLALFTAILALIFWAAIYFFLYWLALIAVTLARGADAKMPDSFFPQFITVAAILCVVCLIARRFFPNDERPRDHQSIPRIAADLLLAVPRATLSVWGTLTAFQFLNEHELGLAWRLLQKIAREERVGMHALPVEIPDARLQRKIVLALQLAELVEFKKTNGDFVLTFRNTNARALCQPHVKVTLRS